MSVNWKLVGAGFVLAAAGVGAGDVVTSAVSGASFGLALLWALLVGAFFKYYLNEGMARYQLATKKTFMEGYTEKSKYFNWYFIVYLVIWAFVVGGALLSGIGFVTNAMFPALSPAMWAVLSSLVVFVFVINQKYIMFEKVMKIFAFIMAASFLISAIIVFPSILEFIKGFIPSIPDLGSVFDSTFKVLALMGGVGGTVTIMAYSYWIKEKNIVSTKHLSTIKWDLFLAYAITFIFGMGIMIVASSVIPSDVIIEGKPGVMVIANSLSTFLGPIGFWIFSLGFWAAIFSSLLSFYQAIPYLFSDAVRLVKKEKKLKLNDKYYKAFQLFCVFPPMLLLFLKQPFTLILFYSVLGAFFMPFIALMMLIIGNSKELGKFKNSLWHNIVYFLVLGVMIVISFWPLIQKYII